jgi:hypothetical protein
MENPFDVRAATLEIRRSVVPEFATSITSSGALRGNLPLITITLLCDMDAPKDLQALIVASVS